MRAWIERQWYAPSTLWRLWWPLHLLMRAVVGLRRALYRFGLLPSKRVDVPVIVVGNIVVGGAGKTPVVLAVCERLRAKGWRPGILSRGYKSAQTQFPARVPVDGSAAQFGDEPVLLARRSGVPVVIDPKRARGAEALIAAACNVVVCDDGLQHYALQRDIEIHVLDAVRQVGNGWLLPAGPLREPVSRLREVDLRIGNGAVIAEWAEHVMHLPFAPAQALHGDRRVELAHWRGQRVHAVAGIGHPDRFFSALEAMGLLVERHAFADHHAFTAADLPWRDAPVLMTEKDAVKCARFAQDNFWFVPVQADLPPAFWSALAAKLADRQKR